MYKQELKEAINDYVLSAMRLEEIDSCYKKEYQRAKEAHQIDEMALSNLLEEIGDIELFTNISHLAIAMKVQAQYIGRMTLKEVPDIEQVKDWEYYSILKERTFNYIDHIFI